ncbi:FGGY family carbohydrate kinase [Pseudomonas aeruginosa]
MLWRPTRGRSHRPAAPNASRTLLFNIHSQDWDEELLALFEIPRSLLPEVLDCAGSRTAPAIPRPSPGCGC